MEETRNIERILLVAGAPDTGKSVQLRSIFLDCGSARKAQFRCA